MCEECYLDNIGTSEQVFDIDISIDDEEIYEEILNKSCGATRHICFECLYDIKNELNKEYEQLI